MRNPAADVTHLRLYDDEAQTSFPEKVQGLRRPEKTSDRIAIQIYHLLPKRNLAA